MEELLSAKLICKRQRLACNSVQTKPEASSSRSKLRRNVSWLRLDALLLILCDVQRPFLKRYDPIILFVEDIIHSEDFSWGKNENSITVIPQVIHQTDALLHTLLNHCCTEQGFPGTSQIFSLIFLIILDTVETEMLFFPAILVFFWHGRFS